MDFMGKIQTIDVFNTSAVTGAYVLCYFGSEPDYVTVNPLSGVGHEPWDTSDTPSEGRHCYDYITLTGQAVAAVTVEIQYTIRPNRESGRAKVGL